MPELRRQVEFIAWLAKMNPMKNEKLFHVGFIGSLLASFGLYTWLAKLYPLWPSLSNPLASWVSMVGPSFGNVALHLAIYLALILLYIGLLWLLVENASYPYVFRRKQTIVILVTWLCCSGILLTMSPAGESHDIYDYIFRGRMITVYHGNPLVVVPDDYSLSTPYTRYLAWRKNVDTYGPVWEIYSATVSTGVRLVAQGLGWWDEQAPVCPHSTESCRLLTVYVTGYRIFAIILTGLSAWLIATIIGRCNPSLVPLGLAAWLLNPLTLFATALGAHNDAVMLVFILLGCWFMQRQKPFLGILSLIIAAHVKLTALIWFPAAGLWILYRWGWKRTIRVGLGALVSGIVLSWFLYAPFGGWQTLPRMLNERSKFLANSIWSVLKYFLYNLHHWPKINANLLSINLPTYLSVIGVILIPLWQFNILPKRWRHSIPYEDIPQNILWKTMVIIGCFYLAVGSYWFQHWYILWVLTPAVLLSWHQFTRFILPWWAFGALVSNVVTNFLLTAVPKSGPVIWVYLATVAMIWMPFLVAAIIVIGRRKNVTHLERL